MADRFKVGDWVVNGYTGNVGWVEEILNYSLRVKFIKNRHNLRMDIPFTQVLEFERVTLMPPEPNIFHTDVLDIALLTKDIAWCEELQKLKGTEQRGGKLK